MSELEASRTLVKSAPELWAECSDGPALSRHLGAFGEIRITKLEPETSVAWEGDDVSGTVTLEPSGWGTRVVLRATPERAPQPAVEVPAEPEPEPSPAIEDLPAAEAPQPAPVADSTPAADPEAQPSPRPGFFARLMAALRGQTPAVTQAPDSGAPEPAPQPEAAAEVEREPEAELAAPAAPKPTPAPPTPSTPELEALIGALDSLGTAHRRPFSRG